MRKKFVQAALALAAVVMMVSCAKSDQEQVKEVATSFVKASLAADYAKMKECVTPAYAEAIAQAEAMQAGLPQEIKDAIEESRKKLVADVPALTFGEATVNGETAQITLTSDNQLLASVGTLNLVKKDGKWLIDMPAAPAQEMMESTEATDSTATDSSAVQAAS